MLRLRPYYKQDSNEIVKWIQSEKQFFQWSSNLINQYPLTSEVLHNYYTQKENNPNAWVMVAIDENSVQIGRASCRERVLRLV